MKKKATDYFRRNYGREVGSFTTAIFQVLLEVGTVHTHFSSHLRRAAAASRPCVSERGASPTRRALHRHLRAIDQSMVLVSTETEARDIRNTRGERTTPNKPKCRSTQNKNQTNQGVARYKTEPVKARSDARLLRQSNATASAFTFQSIVVKIQVPERSQGPKLHRYRPCANHEASIVGAQERIDTCWAGGSASAYAKLDLRRTTGWGIASQLHVGRMLVHPGTTGLLKWKPVRPGKP